MVRTRNIHSFEPSRSRRSARAGAAVLLSLISTVAVTPLLAQSGPLFPQPFRVEHHVVQDDGDGSRFVGEPVVDTYGGSWIVSERPDGSRLIVDLVRRELTEVRAAKGTYWTLSFDRLAELQGRMRHAQGLEPRDDVADAEANASRAASGASATASAAPAAAGELVVTEVPATEKGAAGDSHRALGTATAAAVSARPGVKHLRVSRRGETTGVALDVWVDPSVRLSPPAQAALAALEAQVLAPAATPARRSAAGASRTPAGAATPAPGASPARYLAAVRAHAAGALPVRTLRPLHTTADGTPLATIEDVATRLEALERFPAELAEIPEGLRRVPHPLEATVRFLEEDAVRNAAMSGAPAAESH